MTEYLRHRRLEWWGSRRFDLEHLKSTLPLDRPQSLYTLSNKPYGFWIGIDGSWIDFCRAEAYGNYSHVCNVRLAACCDLRVLCISSPKSAQTFYKKYRTKLGAKEKKELENLYSKEYIEHEYGEPDWDEVQRDGYDGIIIDMPRWTRDDVREFPGTRWLYAYDCRCFVLWNFNGVALSDEEGNGECPTLTVI